MRITNGMMTNNTLSHINLNKLNLDKYSTQESTGKKIQRPSDDPIIAIRALRFRSQLTEITHYLEKNVKDAESWLSLTEEVLSGVSYTLSSMQEYLAQGANDPLDTQDREAVIKTLKGYRDQIYQDANYDFAGRRIFSGYKTDTDMIFATNTNVKYTITEQLNYNDFDTISKVFNKVDISNGPEYIDSSTNDADAAANGGKPSPDDKTDIHRLRLAYEELLEKDADGKVLNLPKLSFAVPAGATVSVDGGTAQTLPEGSKVEIPSGNIINPDGTITSPKNNTVVTMDGGRTITLPQDAGFKVVAPATDGKYYENGDKNLGELDPYKPGVNEIYFLSDTGEIIFGSDAYKTFRYENITVEYDKTSFDKGDLRPEHFFDCTRYDEDGKEDVDFDSHQQDINYTINFNQKLKVNSEGKNFFSHNVIRDLDDLIDGLNELQLIDDKIKNIDKMLADPGYAGEEDQKKLKSMKEAAEKERALQGDIVQKGYEKSISLYSKHQATVDAEIADIGSRDSRLKLNKTRLTNQKTTLEDLKSSNEDINLPETIIQLSAASMVYDASLSAASKVITKSLLDYL